MDKYLSSYIFTPGPVRMYESTLKIGSIQTPYFRNEQFSNILLNCEKNLLQIANAPKDSRVVFLTASGTAAMEATVANLLDKKEDKAIVINGGGFGKRFLDIVELNSIASYDHKVDIEDNLSNCKDLESYKGATALLVNAHETTIGKLYDLQAIGEFTKENNILNIVDAISMFITDEIDMIKFNIDALIISSHKGLALPPGLSMVILTPKAIEKLKDTKLLYFDFKSYLLDGQRGQTPFTPAVTIVLQLEDMTNKIIQNGIDKTIYNYKQLSKYFRENIKDLPLKPYTNYMPNAMTTLSITNGKTANIVVKELYELYNIVVTPNGGDLKEKIFRISHMGYMTKEYIDILIDSLYDYYNIKRR